MSFTVPTAADLALYLGLDEINGTRADLLIKQALNLTMAVVAPPLPDGATAVVLSAAGRAYANPQGATYETIGPMSVQRPQAGLYLTKAEKVSLKAMAGRGGAFTVDPTPKTANPWVSWPIDETAGPGPGLEWEPGWGWV
ncbi:MULTISPECIES: hypothetical protein [Streptomyces]|uniref:Uncharacterized protein n=1 Tax=Streptomyces ehimensis TaxID=68195 RepID=A0ABV9BEU8_9ACTN